MRTVAEIKFRLRQELANVFLYALPPCPAVADVPSPLPGLPDPAHIAAALQGTPWAHDLIAQAEQILGGRVPILGTRVNTGPEPAWRRDYISGKETPAIFFRRIPYLDATQVGDHKNIWELSRHQHLVLVAQAYTLTGDARYSDFVIAQLRHWWRENPFQRGINWASSLEVGFRTLSWLWIYHLLGPAMPAGFRREFPTKIYRHGLHLEYNLSIYFSPNTHLLGEALALHAIGRLIPQFARAADWQRIGRGVMLAEPGKQVHADGGYNEQSTWYHVYALDMYLFHHALEPLPNTTVLEAMAEFLAAIVTADGSLPFLGDDDGGRVFHPFGPRRGFARATLATGSVVLDHEYFAFDNRDLYDQALWWLGPRALSDRPANTVPVGSRCFPDFGLISLQSGDIRILFDVGPFGPLTGGHSHSDTLSIVVSAGANEILIDPGTYTYVGDPTWRDYFRGSAAHNTLRVNGRDQADPDGPFRWRNKPVVKILDWRTGPELDIAEAVCTYANIRHCRKLTFDKPAQLLPITDVIEAGAPCDIEQFWHVGEHFEEHATLSLDPRLQSESQDSWRSDAHASKRPATVIRATIAQAPTPAQFVTTLRIHNAQ